MLSRRLGQMICQRDILARPGVLDSRRSHQFCRLEFNVCFGCRISDFDIPSPHFFFIFKPDIKVQ